MSRYLYLEKLEERIAPAVFIVTSLADSGPGSLRDAIELANNSAGADEIIFETLKGTPLTGTIKLLSELPAIADDLAIFGPIADRASALKIDGGKAFNVITILDANVTMTDLTIQNGFANKGGGIYIDASGHDIILQNLLVTKNRATAAAPGEITFGGGIFIQAGTVDLLDSIVSKNIAQGTPGTLIANGGAAYGGGIFSRGELLIDNTLITGNIARGGDANRSVNLAAGGAFGGGVYGADTGGVLVVNESVITGNRALGGKAFGSGAGGNASGGGIYGYEADLYIYNSRIAKNISLAGAGGKTGAGGFGTGGGIGSGGDVSGSLSIFGSVITGNSAQFGKGGTLGGGYGGGIYSYSPLLISDTTVSANKSELGGGLFSSYDAEIFSSTFSANKAVHGGGIYQYSGSLLITNSTLANNKASLSGGAIYRATTEPLEISNSTIAGNSAKVTGGVYLHPGASAATVVSSILATNKGSADPDFSGKIDATHSLIGVVGPGIAFGINVNNLLNTNPLLNRLANNGGPTFTMLPRIASPVVDAGSNPSGQAHDQRGDGFPREIGGATDIGAVEVA